eukprot:751711-Hanusia_phi.AAC.4
MASGAHLARKVKPVEGGVVMPWPARADLEYECIESCGAGSYGEVYKARRRSDGQLVAVKVLESDRYAMGESVLVETLLFLWMMLGAKASLLRELDHECICKLLDCFECVNECVTCLVMQYASGGDLLERIVKNGPLTEPVKSLQEELLPLTAMAGCGGDSEAPARGATAHALQGRRASRPQARERLVLQVSGCWGASWAV